MRLVLLSTLLSLPALAQTQTYFEEDQALTREAPTTSPVGVPVSATKPLLLTGFTHYRITVCPETGESLTGTGSVRSYLFVRYIGGTAGKWAYNPELDKDITVTGIVDECWTHGFKVDVRKGYLLPAALGVGVSGGSTVTIRIDPDNN